MDSFDTEDAMRAETAIEKMRREKEVNDNARVSGDEGMGKRKGRGKRSGART